MAISIEELDTTVRAFYEGRGDQVRSSPALLLFLDLFAAVASLSVSRPVRLVY